MSEKISYIVLMNIAKTKVATKTSSSDGNSRINVNAVEAIGEKFARINKYLQAGEEIPDELTKNFVTVPLSDDPYSAIP
jgi:hypothetical protein